MNIFVIFAVLLVIFEAAYSGNQELLQIENTVGSLSNVVNTFGNDLNNEFKPQEVQNAINMVDTSMLGYGGSAKNYLDDIRSLNSNASLMYKNSKDIVLECCVSLESSLKMFTQQTSKQNIKKLSVEDQELLWKMKLEALMTGASKINESLNLLENAQYTRKILKDTLDTMDNSLKRDERELEESMKINEKRTEEPKIENVLEKLWNHIKKLFIGYFKPMNTFFYGRNEKVVEDNKIKIAKIEKNIKNAILVVETSISLDFAEDKNNIKKLTRVVSDYKKLFLDVDAEWADKFEPRLNKLLDSCNLFLKKKKNE